jgi:photosystem II stability/assembly factor-like uncharacterized protein
LKALSFLALASLLAAHCAAGQAPGPAPRPDAWKIIGPGGGGTTASPTISPNDPKLVVLRCDMTGAYITHDGGNSWRMFNLRGGLASFAFDPNNPKRIYAGGAALWRSDDTGATWSMVFPDPAKKTLEHQNGDHSEFSLTTEDESYVPGMSIGLIVVDPKDSSVHIAFWDKGQSATSLLVSKDGGTSFQREADYPSDGLMFLSYNGGNRLALGLRGVNTLQLEKTRPVGGPDLKITHAAGGDSSGRTTLYTTTSDGGLSVSEDEGRSWQVRTPELGQQGAQFGAVAAASENGQIAYVGFRDLKMGEQVQDFYNGIAKTIDGGKSWSIVLKESTKPASNMEGGWIEQRANSSNFDGSKSIIFDAPYSLAVAPGHPEIVYATDMFRTYRTLDGGKTWVQVNSVRVGDNRWTTRGLDVTTSYGVEFDPFDPKHIFIDYTDIGAFQSYDGGQSWETATNGVEEEWRNTTYWLAFDPDVKGLMWGAFSYIHDLPHPKMWRKMDAVDFTGGVEVSTDGGKHWAVSIDGMDQTAVTHILVDPVSPVGSRYLYACGFGKGVYKSMDNGKTWELKNFGIQEQNPYAWRIVRSADGVLYLIVARSNDGRFGAKVGNGALYKSIDEAEHWKQLPLPNDVNGPIGLAIDPRDSKRMYLAAWGQEHTGVDIGGGVYLTTDGGRTWTQSFGESQHVYDVTIDPKSPDTLYIAGFDAGAWRSTDAGARWQRIQGYNFKWGHRVIVDPQDPSQIYITTFGGSVWHGPAAGDPKASEDIVTPVPVAH